MNAMHVASDVTRLIDRSMQAACASKTKAIVKVRELVGYVVESLHCVDRDEHGVIREELKVPDLWINYFSWRRLVLFMEKFC